MPQMYRNRSGSGAPPMDLRSNSTERSDDLQDTAGNAAVNDMIRTQGAGTANDSATGSMWAAGASALATGTETAQEETPMPKLAEGRKYILRADDMQYQESATWSKIARDNGMSADHLVAFNQQVQTVDAGTENEHQISTTPTLAAGVEIYLPSSDEILFSQLTHRMGTMEDAIAEWGSYENSANRKIMEQARARASGQVGVGYGTAGDNGVFYTQNPEIAGASSRRSTEINGEREYKINWGADFWKCSVFMHDVVYSAGFKPDMTDNNHYRLAGQLHQSAAYREVKVDAARPGNLWQRFGGSSSNESHNAVLSSFVEVEDVDSEWERWTFRIIGAESERAAESERSHLIKKGTNENNQGKRIRFFEPKSAR